MTDIAKLAIRAETQGVKQSTDQLNKLSGSAAKAEKSTDNYAKQSIKASKASGNLGNQARQVSMQLSQVAQQGSVTGNYFQALAIQIPDLLLPFGTLAIVIGAVAGSLAGPLLSALQDNESETEDLSDKVRDLTNDYDDATEAQKRFYARETQGKIEDEIKRRDEANKKIEDYTKWLAIAKENLDNLAPSIGKWGDETSAEQMEKRRIKLEKNIQELSDSLLDQQTVFDTASQQIERYNELIKDPSGSTEERRNAIQDLTKDLEDQIAKLTLSEKELLQRELMLNGATEAEIKNALALQSTVEQINAETEALKEQERARESLKNKLSTVESQVANPAERARMQFEERNNVIQLANEELNISEERYNQLRTQNAEKLSADLTAIERKTQDQKNMILTDGQQAALAASSELFGNLAAIAKEGGKEQFEEYKALASAQALISASLAAIKALAEGGPVLGPILAASIGALTAVQIAKIQDQEYQGARAMGGQVSSGNSYLVGENGPEIVHMNGNGNVQANHNIGGANNVTVNMTFQGGVTKADLAAALPSVSKAVYNQVFAAINAGGTESQAVRRRA